MNVTWSKPKRLDGNLFSRITKLVICRCKLHERSKKWIKKITIENFETKLVKEMINYWRQPFCHLENSRLVKLKYTKVDWSNWHIVKVHRDSSNDGKFVFTGRNVPLIEFFCLCLLPFFSRCKLLVIKPSCTLPEGDVNFSKLLDLSALKCHEWKGRTNRGLVKIWIHEKRRYTKAQNTQELPVIQENWWKGINWLRGWINLAALNVYKCKCICWTRT